MTDQDVADQQTGAAPVPPGKGGSAASRLRALVGKHKLATAIAVLLVAAAVAGVATGSLKSTPASSTSAGSGDDSITYASPAAAPAFSLAALGATNPAGAGGTVSLAQYANKPLIVNFFASWCTPCQQETPLIARFYKANGGHVIIVGVDGNDTTAKAVAFVRAKGVTYPVGTDPQLFTASAYDVSAFPQTFFLNSRHQIVFRVLGSITQAQLQQGVRLMGGQAS
jgi:thiol-disulfide isomerase/thioredoxin